MLLSDVSNWKNKFLKELLDMLENFTKETFDKNRLLLSYNPMMSIALTADLLTAISNNRSRFAARCKNLKQDLLQLGKVFNSKLEEL